MIFQKYRLNEARDKTMKRQKRREKRKVVRKAKRDKNK